MKRIPSCRNRRGALRVDRARIHEQGSLPKRSARSYRAGGLERQSYCGARPFDFDGNPVRFEDIPQGGTVHVIGSGDTQSQIVAIVSARAPTVGEARDLTGMVKVSRRGGTFRVNGPPAEGWAVWQVSFVLEAPNSGDLDLTTPRGSVTVEGVSGAVMIQTGG